jgi:hypothetical protein
MKTGSLEMKPGAQGIKVFVMCKVGQIIYKRKHGMAKTTRITGHELHYDRRILKELTACITRSTAGYYRHGTEQRQS